MTMRGEPTDRCCGCGQTVPLRDLYVLRAGAFCNRCARGGGIRAMQPRTYGPPAACRNPTDLRKVADLRQRGEELRQAGEEADRATRLSYHESGHAVVAYALNIPLARVEVDVPGGCGLTERGNGGPMWTVESAASWLYGGQLAEQRRFGACVGAVDDDAVLRDLADVARGGALDQAHAQARDILAANWPAVQALATELMRRRTLDSFDVECVLATRMRRGTEQRDTTAPTDRRVRVAEAARVDDRVFDELRSLDFDATLAEVARRYGVTVEAAQQAFNARCRRRYGLDGQRAEIRDFPFTPTA